MRMSPTPRVDEEDEELEEQRPVKQTVKGALRQSAHWKCFILTMLIITCLATIAWCRTAQVTKVIVNFKVFPITSKRNQSPCHDGYLYLPIAFLVMLYLVYLVECFHCPLRSQMKNTLASSEVLAQIEAMREAQPVIWWKAVCYHYVRRARHITRYRNGDAYTSTQVFYERVNSQTAGSCFLFANCGVKDVSKKLIHLSKFSATKVRFSKGFAFVNLEAASEFEEQRTRFFQENERRDDYMEMREGLDLTNVNFKEFLIAHSDSQELPWYRKTLYFWIASIFLFSWPLRLLIEYNTAYVTYQVTKLFGVNYITPGSTGRASRGSAGTESRELEMTIANNCSLVPSYSEALLMDSSGHPSGLPQTMDANGNIQQTPGGIPTTLSSYSLSSSRGGACGTLGRRSSTRESRNSLSQSGSISRSSLHNGYVLYYPSPLVNFTPTDPFQGRGQTTPTEIVPHPPPCYEDALRVSAPLLGAMSPSPLRRSHTERDIPSTPRLFHPRHSCHYELETQL